MDLAARVHALEILVEVLIETLPSEQRLGALRLFLERAEAATQTMRQLPAAEGLEQSLAQHVSRLAANVAAGLPST